MCVKREKAHHSTSIPWTALPAACARGEDNQMINWQNLQILEFRKNRSLSSKIARKLEILYLL